MGFSQEIRFVSAGVFIRKKTLYTRGHGFSVYSGNDLVKYISVLPILILIGWKYILPAGI